MLDFMEKNITYLQVFNVLLNIGAITWYISQGLYVWLAFWIPNGILAVWVLNFGLKNKKKQELERVHNG